MTNTSKSTIGQAIDQTISALSSLEKREQEIVISTICSLLDLSLNSARSAQAIPKVAGDVPMVAASRGEPNPKVEHQAHRPSDEHGVDIRTLKNQKQPANALQMACVVAYYLQEHASEEERTKEISAADLERLFKQAGFKLPSRMPQVLVDAKTAGYFESIDRGKYKLTRVGYNLVTHSLPKVRAS
jgi:hypothetical protein